MIRRVVTLRTMPPWFASKEVGHWTNDRSLSDSDRETILTWAREGYPEGDPAERPQPRSWPTSDWAIGKPDAIYQIPDAQRIPAEGVVPYKYAEIETRLEKDRWVQAIEILPTAPEVVHHVLVFLRESPDSSRKRRRQPQGEVEGYFAGMVPGQTHITYPEGVAKLLPKGSILRFQIHYSVCGRKMLDQTRLGIRFASSPPRHKVQTYGIANRKFSIPPGASNHKVTAEVLLPRDIRIHAFTPHTHIRGKAFRYDVVFPNGKVTPLLSIPHYDFNWQLAYQPRSPIELARGWKVRATAWYDNSPENPANPNPEETVRWGPQSWHEMMIGYVDYSIKR
ncbi:MAG: hypothetical protein QF752_05890 [Planctomycetota bacterium]|jgi:hypothetical protein|nr:hypothetical protein [Planctomycetota bacterium]